MAKIERALISVTDKTGIVDFASGLVKHGVEIISTGGTAALLKEAGIEVTGISDFTGFPEMLDGRVKTLHPKVHGALLGLRDNPDHVATMEEHGIGKIDLVAVNLYEFQKAVDGGGPLEEIIEQIDIGGPSMLRSASKNYRSVSVVTEPADYDSILAELGDNDGEISEATNLGLAKKVFALTARYDAAIAAYLSDQGEETGEDEAPADKRLPGVFTPQFIRKQKLRYGENPHQAAAYFTDSAAKPFGIAAAEQIQGQKGLSYNNILDLDAAIEIVREFQDDIAAIVIKHNNPCGAAISGESIADAYVKARECDPVSAFGSIIAVNRPVSLDMAKEVTSTFVECVVAPSFEEAALEELGRKKNLRVLVLPDIVEPARPMFDMRRVTGGILVQERNTSLVSPEGLKTVTKREPTADEHKSLMFGWRICKHVKSNAIIFALEDRLLGVGAGQMSRIDSVELAANKARTSTEGAIMASDAFFPFRDGMDEAARYGIRAVIQPGGSIRDEEVIEAADEHDIAMVFTGMRHFRH